MSPDKNAKQKFLKSRILKKNIYSIKYFDSKKVKLKKEETNINWIKFKLVNLTSGTENLKGRERTPDIRVDTRCANSPHSKQKFQNSGDTE